MSGLPPSPLKQLGKKLGRSVSSLLVMDRENDPFAIGTAKHHQWAQWFAELHGGSQVRHLRRLHYVAVSVGGMTTPDGSRPYENVERHWQKLNEAARYARHLGYVSPSLIEDRRNPPPEIYFEARECPTPRVEMEVDRGSWFLPSLSWQLDDIRLTVGHRPIVHGYDWDPEHDEPVHVEVWVEKTTVNDVLEPLCRRLNVNFIAGPGFQSITNAHRLTRRAPTDRPTRILYISDFDPAGAAMPRAVARQLEFYARDGSDIALRPLVLTRSQVDDYDLPRIPIKDTDNRKANFEERNGSGAVELDALEALHPGTLVEIVRDAVAELRDGSIRDELADVEAEADAEAERVWQATTAGLRDALDEVAAEVNEVLDRYRPDVSEIADRLWADLAPSRGRLVELERWRTELLENFEVDLPDRPVPVAPTDDPARWAFHSGRTYLNQLGSYREWWGQ